MRPPAMPSRSRAPAAAPDGRRREDRGPSCGSRPLRREGTAHPRVEGDTRAATASRPKRTRGSSATPWTQGRSSFRRRHAGSTALARALRTRADAAREDHARIQERVFQRTIRFDCSGLRSTAGTRNRSSSMSAARSISAARQRRPKPWGARRAACRCAPAWARARRARSERRRRVTLPDVERPGLRGPRRLSALSRIAAGMTTRPALSMVERMVKDYHAPASARGRRRAGLGQGQAGAEGRGRGLGAGVGAGPEPRRSPDYRLRSLANIRSYFDRITSQR